ncbi:MAG: rhodanese-like domain-containing protein [Acidobacteria bacterium]|nr:MAG: rhodanese-like domain-containing protein [Acidobacteriota bacterium]
MRLGKGPLAIGHLFPRKVVNRDQTSLKGTTMRRLLLLLLAVAPIAAVTIPPQVETDPAKVARMTIAELRKLQASGSVTLVDVRDADSFKAGHIPGALSIPLDQLSAQVNRLKGAKKPLVFYCA